MNVKIIIRECRYLRRINEWLLTSGYILSAAWLLAIWRILL